MYLKDLFDQLTQGELKGLSLGGYEGDELLPKDYVRILPHINLALTELYKQFRISTKIAYIQMDAGITTYHLHPKYAVTNTESGELIKYIVNSESNPFTGGVFKIEEIFECSEYQCGLTEYEETLLVPERSERCNDRNQLHSYWINTPTSIQVKVPEQGKLIAVTYRAGPPRIVAGTEADLWQEIYLPPCYLQALLYYIASRATASLPPAEGYKASTLHMQMYQQEVNNLITQGLDINDNTTCTKLNDNGWV